MGYSLKVIECVGATNPQLFVCEMATAHNDLLADVKRVKEFDRKAIILVMPDHQGELLHVMKSIELTAPVVACNYDVIEMAKAGRLSVIMDPGEVTMIGGDREGRLRAMANEIRKQAHDIAQCFDKDELRDLRPPKNEIRWQQQQNRYRQNYHSRNFKKR